MKINNRHKKIESEKLIKEVLMYIYLINDFIVYDTDLNVISPTIKRSMQRYASELIHSGAIPKIRLKTSENGLYYKVNEDILETNKKFYKYLDNEHTERLARILSLVYLMKLNHPIVSNRRSIEEFYANNLNITNNSKTIYRDLRLIKIAKSYYINKN